MKIAFTILILIASSAMAESDPENKLDAGHVVLDYNDEFQPNEFEQEFKESCLKEFSSKIETPKSCREFYCAGFTLARELVKSDKTAEQSRKADEKAWLTYRDNECWESRLSKSQCLDLGGRVEIPAGSDSKKSSGLPIRDVWCRDAGKKNYDSCIGTLFCVENWSRK